MGPGKRTDEPAIRLRPDTGGQGTRVLTILLIVVLLVLLFGGGGYYYRGRRRF